MLSRTSKIFLMVSFASIAANAILFMEKRSLESKINLDSSTKLLLGSQLRSCELKQNSLTSTLIKVQDEIGSSLEKCERETSNSDQKKKLSHLAKSLVQIFNDDRDKTYLDGKNEEIYKTEMTSKYIDAVNTKAMFERSVNLTIRKQLNVPESMQEKADDLVNKYFSWEVIKPSIIEAYTDTLTLEELKVISEFSETNIGKSISEKIPNVLTKINQSTKLQLEQNKIQLAKELATLKAEYENQLQN